MLEDLFVGADSPIKGQVDTFAQLPATAELGDLFVVRTTTGVIGVNRKIKGLYRWDGAAWVFADGIEANKVIYNNADSSLTSGTVKAAIDELDTKLSGIEPGADVTDSTNVSAAGALMRSGGTMTGDLQVNARLDVGDGSANDTEIRIYKNDNNVSDHLQFYNGTTRIGEIGCEDFSWLRINQETDTNIYTPRIIRADGGFQVDGNDVITEAGVHTGDGSSLTNLNASSLSSGTVSADRLPFTESGKSAVGNFGQFYGHGSYTDFNADVADWGWSFVKGSTNAPNTTSAQWYRLRCGLGSEYGFQSGGGDYWLELAYPRFNQSTAGCYMRTCQNGNISTWVEIGGLPSSATFGDGISTDGSDVYTGDGAFIAKDQNGAFASRTGNNIDHIWHDNTNNAWNFCSDTTYKSTGNSDLKASGLHLQSTGVSKILIDADTDNVDETHTAYIKMTQDGGAAASIMGFCAATNKSPENLTYTGAISNSILIANLLQGSSLLFGTNDSGVNAVRVRIAANGDVYIYNDLRVTGNAIVSGSLSKGSGSFDIEHPDPAKKDTHRLRHYFVETPSAGGNIYKYQLDCNEGENYIHLPDYFQHLNTDSLVWANAFKHFGRAWGEVIENGKRAKIVCEQSGVYNILIFGDRKDKLAVDEFTKYGVEYKVDSTKEKTTNDN